MSNTLSALRERVEACEAGGDRELDCAIAVALGGFFIKPPRYEGAKDRYCKRDPETGGDITPGQAGDMLVPTYTSSMDAALALVERELKEPHFTFSGPAKFLNIPTPIPNYWWAEIIHDFPGKTAPRGWGATAPLALLSALLATLGD